jgi:phage-related protein
LNTSSHVKTIVWVGSSRTDLKAFPGEVQKSIGYALYQAQKGFKAPTTKPLHGFGSASMLEIIEDYQTNTYRAVYTVKFADFIYVLHTFQKKSKKGGATPKPELDLIKRRLRSAEEHHKTEHREKEPKK